MATRKVNEVNVIQVTLFLLQPLHANQERDNRKDGKNNDDSKTLITATQDNERDQLVDG